jgi:4-nitrophenyl phosphatase
LTLTDWSIGQALLRRVKAYVIDMDGVLYRGEERLPYVREFLSALDGRSIPYLMATNNSMRSPEQYVEKLSTMGIDLAADRILTSGMATSLWLRERFARGTRVYIVGMPALHQAILGDGYFEPAERDAEVVVSGADFTLTYDKLRIATLAIRAGARYIATNGDTTFPTEEGIIPGAGAIIAALRAATGVEPDIIGKPAIGMIEEALDVMRVRPAETVMLGDRLDTDILAGQRAGMVTVLVLTGVTSEAEAATSDIRPDVTLHDLRPLVELYNGGTD